MDWKLKLFIFIVGVIIALLILRLFTPVKVGAHTENQTVCFCHNLAHNPHTICTNNEGLINGHMAHVESGFDSLGECTVPTPTPSPTPKDVCSNLDGVQTEIPQGYHNVDGECVPNGCEWDCELTPTPTITPTVTPTPTETPCTENCGVGNVPDNPHTNTTNPPAVVTCNIPFTAPVLVGYQNNGRGSVIFNWLESAQGIEKFSIVYGYSPDKLVYGADNLSADQRSITINGLDSGKSVWAQVYGWVNGCAEVSNLYDPIVQ